MKMKHLVLLVSLVLCLASTIPVAAQKKPAVPTSALCTRDNAVDTTKQQLLLTRTFDNLVQRITVLLRAADLLWPHEQDRKSTRLNSSHLVISYAVFCLKKKTRKY